jgi:serralysin
MAIINGTAGDDSIGTLQGTAGDDTINGLAGNDVLWGVEGADTLNGGDGNDAFFYQFGGEITDGMGHKDIIDGGNGTDVIQVLDSIELKGATISSIEGIIFTDTLMVDSRFVGIEAAQIGNGLSSALALKGDVGDDILQINMANANVLDMSKFSFSDWQVGKSVFLGDRIQVNGDASNEKITGSMSNDYMESGAGNDRLIGNAGADTLNAGDGIDRLNGGLGRDSLTGGAGKDIFEFTTKGGSANRDTISDFSVADDTIRLSKSVYHGFASTGVLDSHAFKTLGVAGATLDADDRMIYNRATGVLTYDSNGSAAGGVAVVAKLDAGLHMTHLDFFVLA